MESRQRWVEANTLCYSSQPTTPHRTPLLLPSSVPVRSPTLVPVAAPPPASVPGPSNYNPSSITNTSPPTHAPARVTITPQESPTRFTPPAGTLPENKQSFQEVKTEVGEPTTFLQFSLTRHLLCTEQGLQKIPESSAICICHPWCSWHPDCCWTSVATSAGVQQFGKSSVPIPIL